MVNTRRGGLGRGLGALIPTAPVQQPPAPAVGQQAAAAQRGAADASSEPARPPGSTAPTSTTTASTTAGDMVPVPGARFAELAVSDIRPNPKQPRQVFDEVALAELAHSLREVGFLQPVVVRETGAPDGPAYELVMGERRLRAAQQAGLDRIPAIVRDTGDEALLRDALLENLHREQLNPLEEGAAYAQLLEEFGATHDELAKRIGRSRSQVTNTIRLLNLPATVQRKVAAGVLSAGHARALLGLADADAQERLSQRIVAEGLSVRAVEELVAVGEEGAPRKRTARPARRRAPALDDLAAGLSDQFETRVKVELGRSKGKITIEFASIDDLERIVATMAPELSPQARAAAGS
ncbi:MAG TPA: ParB/RepB/Spo0J family partition protein [Acidothermaceae bacterium]